MVKIINKNLNHVAKLGRSSFDMSKDVKFTSSVGQLLPIYWDILNYGDKVKIGSSIFTRTKPLATPAFVSIEEHVDYFFVPFKQLYSFFGNKVTDMSQFDTTLISQLRATKELPTISLFNIFEDLKTNYYHNEQQTLLSYARNYGVPLWMDALRLIDLFGINYKPFYDYVTTPGADVQLTFPWVTGDVLAHVNAFPFLAYHKIFYDHYRNQEFTLNRPDLYNADSFETSTFDGYRVELLKMHYRPWNKDFFTNIHISPLHYFENNLGLTFGLKDYPTLNSFGNYDTSASGSSAGVVNNPSFTQEIPSVSQSVGSIQTRLSPFGIRAMYAYDKLLRITQLAPKDVDAQIAAHFGWKVPQGVDGRVIYIGSDDSRIDVGEIAATSDTLSADGSSGAQLGALAGKGAGYRDGKAKFEFTAPYAGILMAIYSAVPTADYQNNFDKLLMYRDVDYYYRPEFEDLGLQPIFASQLAEYKNPYSGVDTSKNFILGFQYRWSELKQKFPTIHGDFIESLPDWVVNRNKNSLRYSDIQVLDDDRYNWLYCNPISLDSITEVNFTPTSPILDEGASWDDTVFTRDPLMSWITVHCFKTSTMSMYDLPNM